MKFRPPVIITVIIFVALAATAQQRIPTLTTDDIVAPSSLSVSKSVSEEKKTETTDKLEKKSSEKDSLNVVDGKKIEGNPEEKLWNEKLQRSKEKAAQLARLADQADLEINQLRNKLSSAQSSSPEQKREALDKIAKLSKALSELRESAQSSQSEVDEAVTNGKEKEFKVSAPKLINEKGEVDHQAVNEQSIKYQQEVIDAQFRIQLMQLQLSKLHNQGNQNADRYKLNQINTEREQINQEIEKMNSKISEASAKLEGLKSKDALGKPPLR